MDLRGSDDRDIRDGGIYRLTWADAAFGGLLVARRHYHKIGGAATIGDFSLAGPSDATRFAAKGRIPSASTPSRCLLAVSGQYQSFTAAIGLMRLSNRVEYRLET